MFIRRTPPRALSGSCCPLIVQFKDVGVEYDAYAGLVERQISEGCHGLLVNATSGEPTTLTPDERFEIAVMAKSVSAGRVLVGADRASQSHAETVSLFACYAKLDVDSIVVVTPY